jgi:hypothetical protein
LFAFRTCHCCWCKREEGMVGGKDLWLTLLGSTILDVVVNEILEEFRRTSDLYVDLPDLGSECQCVIEVKVKSHLAVD